jgi:methylmalonyl-CoA mutase cobalamin-binding subunit
MPMGLIGRRLARLEAIKTKAAVVVVSGYSAQEHERAIAELIAKGNARERDLFVCLMRFGEQHD